MCKIIISTWSKLNCNKISRKIYIFVILAFYVEISKKIFSSFFAFYEESRDTNILLK